MIEDDDKARQSQALDINRPAGAMLETRYLQRQQEVIAVNKSDLEDIATDKGTESILYSVAAFFGAGPSWLLVDKVTSSGKFELSMTNVVCSMAMLFGFILFVFGKMFSNRAMSRIQRILKETSAASANIPATGARRGGQEPQPQP